jgi:hypothetical protein
VSKDRCIKNKLKKIKHNRLNIFITVSFMITIFSHVCPTISDFYICSSFWYLEVKINKRQIDFFINLLIIWWHTPKKCMIIRLNYWLFIAAVKKKIFFMNIPMAIFGIQFTQFFLKLWCKENSILVVSVKQIKKKFP